jgi:hypothetical protein
MALRLVDYTNLENHPSQIEKKAFFRLFWASMIIFTVLTLVCLLNALAIF